MLHTLYYTLHTLYYILHTLYCTLQGSHWTRVAPIFFHLQKNRVALSTTRKCNARVWIKTISVSFIFPHNWWEKIDLTQNPVMMIAAGFFSGCLKYYHWHYIIPIFIFAVQHPWNCSHGIWLLYIPTISQFTLSHASQDSPWTIAGMTGSRLVLLHSWLMHGVNKLQWSLRLNLRVNLPLSTFLKTWTEIQLSHTLYHCQMTDIKQAADTGWECFLLSVWRERGGGWTGNGRRYDGSIQWHVSFILITWILKV